MDVADWLRALDLGQYESAFHENSITAELLPSLTSEDLKDLGISRVGHRRRLLDAIATLRTGTIPDTLVIDEATRRQVGGLFELADLGPQALAGFAAPQPAWCVLGESEILSRFEALRSEVTPLIGRDEELNLLQRRWQQAKAGEGRLVLLSGDAGIGKSRLVAALVQYIAGESHTRLRYFCSPHNQDSALHPFVAQLERAAGLARDETAEQKLSKLESLLAPGARGPEEIAVIAELLSLPNITEQLNLTPQRKRETLFDAFIHQLEAIVRRGPVLMIFEDAHWIDPTSRELLEIIVNRVSRMAVVLVITFRPEFHPPWTDQPNATVLTLSRLGACDGTMLIQDLAGHVALDRDVIAEIVERTDGVPLFIEELTKAVLESGAANRALWNSSLMRQPIPKTVSLAQDLMHLARAGGDPRQLAIAHRALAYSLFMAGRLAEAADIFPRGAELADNIPDSEFAIYGEHPSMVCRVNGGWVRVSPKPPLSLVRQVLRTPAAKRIPTALPGPCALSRMPMPIRVSPYRPFRLPTKRWR